MQMTPEPIYQFNPIVRVKQINGSMTSASVNIVLTIVIQDPG
jgi:hypothetical protein